MPALPVEIVALLGLFASEFTTVTFEKIKLLFERELFMKELNELIKKSSFKIISVVIKKKH